LRFEEDQALHILKSKLANLIPITLKLAARRPPAIGANKSFLLAGILLGSVLGVSANQLTFNVNMVWQKAWGGFHPESGDTVVVSGTFSSPDWTTTSTLSPGFFDTNVYTGTFTNDVPAGSFVQFKFIINPGGNSPANQLIWESGNNRSFQVASFDQTFTGAYFDNVTNGPPVNTNAPGDFIAGVDFSHLKFFEDRGIVYKDGGVPTDALTILSNRGINCVRLRLFTSSAAQATSDPYNYTNNLAYNVPLAVRVKNAGLKFLLDFHYSDSWADPGKQFKPSAWTNLNFSQLVAQMRSYNSNCVAAFQAAGAMPDYVQIGNEIIGGMLWNDGRVGGAYDNSTQWHQLRQLINAAIQGVNEASTGAPPKIIVHIDRGGDWGATQWFFDHLAQTPDPVAFDIIGESYYPWWHGNLSALSNCLRNAAQRYNKPIIVAETAFPWTNSVPLDYDPELGIAMTPAGQIEYTIALASIVKGVPGGLGIGIFWWGTEYVQLSGYNLANFHKTSFFDYQGNTLPVAGAFGQLSFPVEIQAALIGNNLSLKWPLSGVGMRLTRATSLWPTSSWLDTTNNVESTGAILSVTLPLEAVPATFYRLQSD
jgi:arabinogalactan endo-1,4-beta-galactosidase